jgi:hypothetical protein
MPTNANESSLRDNNRIHCCPVNLGSPARNGMILNGILSI